MSVWILAQPVSRPLSWPMSRSLMWRSRQPSSISALGQVKRRVSKRGHISAGLDQGIADIDVHPLIKAANRNFEPIGVGGHGVALFPRDIVWVAEAHARGGILDLAPTIVQEVERGAKTHATTMLLHGQHRAQMRHACIPPQGPVISGAPGCRH